MLKKLKSIVFSSVLITGLLGGVIVKAEGSVEELLNKALVDKTFYNYNMAYAAIMKIEASDVQASYLGKLATIEKEVLTPTVNNFTIKLDELGKTSSGKLYDEIVTEVSNSTLGEMDKGYLLGELTSWGLKLVYTSDYVTAVEKIKIAWLSLKDVSTNYDNAIKEAENAIANVKNTYSKAYLNEQLSAIRDKHSASNIKATGYVNSDYLNVRAVPKAQENEPIGKLYFYNKINIVDSEGTWYKIVYKDGFAYVSSAYIILYSSPPSNIVDIAGNITRKFEIGSSVQLAGNFDGTGLSLGYFQWSLGPGSLQPLLNRMDNQYNSVMRQIFSGTSYDSIHEVLSKTKEEQLQWAKSINDEQNKIIEPWSTQFINLTNSTEFKEIEKEAEVFMINRAMKICDKYNLKTARGFALALDIAIQNGSIISSASTVIDSAVQKNPNMPEKDLLKLIANTVADNSKSSEDVRARKMAIVNGSGTVHGSMLYLDRDYGLSDANWR
jgi:hypothetical protein